MTHYLDTSLLIAGLTHESETGRIQAWLGDRAPGECAISEWVATEFSAALSIKLRTGQLLLPQRAAALAMLVRLSAESFTVLSVTLGDFRAAARFADQYASGLRAGDALHLAVCASHGLTLCTLDRQLANAAEAMGVPAQLV